MREVGLFERVAADDVRCLHRTNDKNLGRRHVLRTWSRSTRHKVARGKRVRVRDVGIER